MPKTGKSKRAKWKAIHKYVIFNLIKPAVLIIMEIINKSIEVNFKMKVIILVFKFTWMVHMTRWLARNEDPVLNLKGNWRPKSSTFVTLLLESLTYVDFSLDNYFCPFLAIFEKIAFEVGFFALFWPFHCGLKIYASGMLWRMIWGNRDFAIKRNKVNTSMAAVVFIVGLLFSFQNECYSAVLVWGNVFSHWRTDWIRGGKRRKGAIVSILMR